MSDNPDSTEAAESPKETHGDIYFALREPSELTEFREVVATEFKTVGYPVLAHVEFSTRDAYVDAYPDSAEVVDSLFGDSADDE